MSKAIRRSSLDRSKKNLPKQRVQDCYRVTEKNRHRWEKRVVKVYPRFLGISPLWIKLKTIIQVERTIIYQIKPEKIHRETVYFISSLPITTKAKVFHQGIRSHWSIENSLHYIKDKTFQEDQRRIRSKSAPENLSLLTNMVINIFRKHNFSNIAQAIRLVAHDVPRLWQMIIA